ncbi:MAG: PEP-CTERM sorting domain-containing protein [Opitutaceae bacterium]
MIDASTLRKFQKSALLTGGLLLLNTSYGIVNISDPLGNDIAPTGIGGQPEDPGFNNVGQVNGSSSRGSGVYMGNGWVLTANHVNAGDFTVGGMTYSYDGSTSHQIGGTDLRLFKLATSPMLPSIEIADSTPVTTTAVTMISGGRDPEGSLTTWYVDPVTNAPNWIWSESDFPEATLSGDGYKTTTDRTVRWGTNEISGYGTAFGAATLTTNFTSLASGGTDFEAQAVTNDSGGGFFVEEGGQWVLAGTIVTVTGYPDQPAFPTTAIPGSLSSTVAIDLSPFKEEIDGYVVPEPGTSALLAGLGALAVALNCRRRIYS